MASPIRSPRRRGRAARAAREAERLGGLEIDCQFELVLRLDGQLACLLALQDAIDIDFSLSIGIAGGPAKMGATNKCLVRNNKSLTRSAEQMNGDQPTKAIVANNKEKVNRRFAKVCAFETQLETVLFDEQLSRQRVRTSRTSSVTAGDQWAAALLMQSAPLKIHPGAWP